MTRISAGSIFVIVLLLIGPCALAATWTVTNNGYNTTDGEEGNSLANNEGSLPFCMLNAADNDTIVFNGDMTINVVGGDAEPFGDALEAYYGTSLARTDPTWVVTQDGLTIDGGEHEIILDAGFDIDNEPQPLIITPALMLRNTRNVTVRNITVRNSPVGINVAPAQYGSTTGLDAGGNLIENCTVYNCKTTNWGAGIWWEVAETTIRGNHCYDNDRGITGNYITSPSIYLNGSIIEDNTCHGNHSGIDITGYGQRVYDITIRNNYLYGAIRWPDQPINAGKYLQSGVDLTLRGQITDITLYGNVFGLDRNGTPQPTWSDAGVEKTDTPTHPTCCMRIVEGVTNVTIGGTEPGQPNLFAAGANGIALVWIAQNEAVDTAIRGNYIFDQYYTPQPDWTGKAIWWGYDPTTSSPVDLAQEPTVTGLGPITGTGADGTVVDVFVTNVPTESGEEAQCRTYIGSATVSGGTWSLDVDVESIFPGLLVTATATRTSGNRNTSEVSDGYPIPGTAKTDTDNDGMHDEYEVAKGLDPDNPLDAFIGVNGGWTYAIETYIEERGEAPTPEQDLPLGVFVLAGVACGVVGLTATKSLRRSTQNS